MVFNAEKEIMSRNGIVKCDAPVNEKSANTAIQLSGYLNLLVLDYL